MKNKDFTIYKSSEKVGKEVNETPKKANKASHDTSAFKDITFLFVKLISIAVVFILLFTFLFGIIRYQDPSMDPSIKDGDLVLFYRYKESGYVSQDVVVLVRSGETHARRVVAVQGDTVDVTEEGLIVNGALQQEVGIYKRTERYVEGVEFPLVVPEGHVFVLGDYREGAKDSRIYGPVKIENTLGKVMVIIRRRGL